MPTKSIPSWDDELRKLAHDAVDRVFDHIQTIAQRPVVSFAEEEDLAREFPVAFGEGHDAWDADLRNILARAIQIHHPSYIGHQVCPPFPHAAIADFVISALNQSNAVWEMSPATTLIEEKLIRWLADRAGYPEASSGSTVSGGSAANLTALLAARARWQKEADANGLRPVVVCSADTHYSVTRAATIAGLPKSDVLPVATDAHHRLDVAVLDAMLAGMRNEGMSPLAIVATAGTTSTGSFDDLRAIAALRDKYETWLHVDAAHGASVLLSERLRHLVDGLELADSLSWDPHKMLWMPLSLGVVLVRDGRWLRTAFEADAPYLFHPNATSKNLGEITIQCSRRADALKLWLTLRTIGTAPLAAALERVASVTRYLHELVDASDDFEPMHEPEFNIYCFRYIGGIRDLNPQERDLINDFIRDALLRSGEAWITSTTVKGVRALRVTVINPATDEKHVKEMLEAARRVAAELVR
ncbi:MAG: pyridoxal phosphate-dependent decarboxylase family protein [Thermoanaerobaculia bacterium]